MTERMKAAIFVEPGRIVLDERDPRRPPLLDYRYLTDPADRQALEEGVRLAADLLAATTGVVEAGSVDARGGMLGTSLHLSGTCRMGDDENAVVDEWCRVRGIDGLSVVDTSVFPQVPSRGPHATAVLVLLALAADRRGASFFSRDRMAQALGMSQHDVDVALRTLLDGSVSPDGDIVASDLQLGITLWRLTGPLASTTTLTGIYPNDTWSGRDVRWTRRHCRGGELDVGLHSDPNLVGDELTDVLASVRGRPVARISVPPTGAVRLPVPLTAVDGTCVVDFLVTPTRIPANRIEGSTDVRRLGVHFDSFVYRPPA